MRTSAYIHFIYTHIIIYKLYRLSIFNMTYIMHIIAYVWLSMHTDKQ